MRVKSLGRILGSYVATKLVYSFWRSIFYGYYSSKSFVKSLFRRSKIKLTPALILKRTSVFATLILYVAVAIRPMLFAAPDLFDEWTFDTPADYSYGSNVEINSGIARLKALNYADDASTAALYHFDESGGSSASDSSANANNATVYGGGTFASGNLNNAIQLDGQNDYVEALDSTSLKLGQQQTVEGWFQPTDVQSPATTDKRFSIADKGDYQLYIDNETGRATYEIANASATTWTQSAGGNDINGSWGTNTKRSVSASSTIGTDLYVGLGNVLADAEVWMWDGSIWTKIGGDALNGSWDDQTYEQVYSMTNDGTNLYVGLGVTAGDAEVWRWDGVNWTKIGGDAINSSWQVNTFEAVGALSFFGGNLYAGLGTGGNDAEVWRWNGATWTKIGGDSLNSGWTTNFDYVSSMANDGTNLFVGIGVTATEAEVWSWNGATWTKIGGDAVGSSWTTDFETVRALTYVGSTLYAGLGDGLNDAELWSWNGAAWTLLGGDGFNGSWNGAHESISAIGNIGSDIYVGLGTGNGDGDVWRLQSGTWSQVGGDGLNSGWAVNVMESVNSMSIIGSTLYAGLYDAAGGGYVYAWNGTSWSITGGQYVNKSWGYFGQGSVETMQVAGDYMYAGIGSAAGSAQVWSWDGADWSIIGGQGINGSWASNTYDQISSMSSHLGNLYVGLGITGGEAEVWQWNGTSWSQIGGDGLSGSWIVTAPGPYEEVNALASFDGNLYAGLGTGGNDAEVWRWNGSTWTKIGGDSLNTGWTTNYERVSAFAIYDGYLVAGLGASAGDAELWRWNGSAWNKLGGDSLNSSWDNTFEQVEALIPYAGGLYVALGNSTGDGEIWELKNNTWTKIGGDDLNGSWADGTYERVRSLTVYNGDIYAGLGSTAGEGEVWRYRLGVWSKIGGNTLNASWANAMEEVESLSVYRGKLYAGTGNSANVDATVWSYGDNAYVQSTTDSFGVDWHHIAGTYDGTTQRIYINGTLESSVTKSVTVATENRPLLIGAGYAGREQGKPQARAEGLLDEVRLSSVARTSFTTSPYSAAHETISPTTSVRQGGLEQWDTFSQTASLDGGDITYRLSNDDGVSWLYWDGIAWTASTLLTQSNTPATITANFTSFPITFEGLRWQAILKGDGSQQVALDTVNAESTSDGIDPSTNPSNIQAYKTNSGDPLGSGDWTNGGSPYFTWDAGTDADSGILGYCAYLGTDGAANPITTGGLLGTSPVATGGNCAFIVPTNELDLALPGMLGTALMTSNDPVYLTLRSIDRAGNVMNSSVQFSFRFDNTPPTNPSFITAPSGFVNSKDITMTWPTTGPSAPSDAQSGLTGLQYRIGPSGIWYGDGHSGTGDSSDLLTNDGSYTTVDPIDFSNLVEGINTVYFRTWDSAGNVTTSYTTATLKINTSGAPSEPTNLIASPASSTSNSFSFNWDVPVTYIGDVDNITYCYTINAIPSLSSCNYTAAGSTELTLGAYATQPGTNTMYVVARDESSNINYANFSSVEFVANTTAPGMPLNTDIVDVSIKNTSNWRLALTWEAPLIVGEGISSYRIYRSTDNATFTQVGASSSTTYIDAGLSEQVYYYHVTACDSTNNCGAPGSTVSELPTGKFTTPALLTSGPDVAEITTKRAKINWTTDRTSDSKIAIGTSSGVYSPSEVGNSNQVTDHHIDLDNLSPGTTYYIVAKWTDEDGNTGTSPEQTFITAPAPVIKAVEVTSIGLDSASVAFTTQGATKALIYYGVNESFGGVVEINTSQSESRYQTDLANLTDGTQYFYMISTIDQEGAEYRGNIASFSTLPRPRITNLQFQPIDGEPTSTQRVTWQTNVPSNSQVIYSAVNGTPIEIQDSALVTQHEIVIRNLVDDSDYTMVAQSRDAVGNLAVSDRQQFRTALDTRPPKISDIVVESTIRGSGSEARGQIVVSWRTDEPATSQIAYSEGSGAVVFNSRTAEETTLKTEHLVIVSDLPTSRVFSIQPISRDKSENTGNGTTETAIIGRASDNALTVVFNTLKRIFGF
jgi:hypothetical protein